MIWCACDSHSGDDLQLCAGSWTATLSAHMVALHRFQTSLKELSTLPPIFSFKKPSEWGFARVGHAKENKSLLGNGGREPLALEVITGCPVPAADSTAGTLRRFLLPCCGLTHQHNVRRENTENMSHVLLKQTEQRAWLASGWCWRSRPCFPLQATSCLCSADVASATLLHCSAWEVAGDKPDRMHSRALYHSPGQPWPVANKKPFLWNRFSLKNRGGEADYFWHIISKETVVGLQHSQEQHRVPWKQGQKMNFGNMNYFSMPFCGACLKWQWEQVILSRCMCYFCVLFILVIKEERWQRKVFTDYPGWGKGHIVTCFCVDDQCGAFQPIPLLPALCQPQVYLQGTVWGNKSLKWFGFMTIFLPLWTGDRTGSWCWSYQKKSTSQKECKALWLLGSPGMMVAHKEVSLPTVHFSSFQVIRALFSFFSKKTIKLPTALTSLSHSSWRERSRAAQCGVQSLGQKGRKRARTDVLHTCSPFACLPVSTWAYLG